MAEVNERCRCRNLKDKTPLYLIQESAATGCQYCSIIWNSLSNLSGRDADTHWDLIVGSHIQLEDGHLTVLWHDGNAEYLRLFTAKGLEYYKRKEQELTFEQEIEGYDAIVKRNQITTAGSQAFFALIGDWIKECSSDHKLCSILTSQSSSNNSKMPARLLRIDKDSSSTGGYKVSLQESLENVTKYIALSHCWGLHQPLTTTKETLAARKDGINWATLPRTFQDAIIIGAGLNVKYVWIDSLCILQDDKYDWGMESAKMSAIYENAWLTIAAATAPDGAHGCFPTSLPTKEYELQMPNETTPTKVFARRLLSPIDSRDHLLKATNDLPLFQRAWVFQERLLSRRILYLCEDEMAFECATNVRCECLGSILNEAVQGVDGTKSIGLKYRYHSLLNSWNCYKDPETLLPFQPTGILNVWDHFVSQFTQRHLTYDKDRLPALSGIAKMIYHTGALGKYHAGLWEARMAEGLLWFVNPSIDGFDPLPPKVGLSTAPSWSWASVNGSWDYRRVSMEQIYLYGIDKELYVTSTGLELSAMGFACKEPSVELHLASPDFFGGIELGKISLTAPLALALISYKPSEADESYAIKLRDQKVKLSKGEMVAEAFMDFVLDHGGKPMIQHAEVFCVGILPEYNSGKRNIHSLVLLPAEHKGEKVYRRIGKFLAPDGWYNKVGLQSLSII